MRHKICHICESQRICQIEMFDLIKLDLNELIQLNWIDCHSAPSASESEWVSVLFSVQTSA